MLLIPANVELMVLPLTRWEKRVWREAQGRLPAEDLAVTEDQAVVVQTLIILRHTPAAQG
jgi:hypothetical protein